MKRPLAYITAAWYGGDTENAELAAQYCRAVYDAGFAPICPIYNSHAIHRLQTSHTAETHTRHP